MIGGTRILFQSGTTQSRLMSLNAEQLDASPSGIVPSQAAPWGSLPQRLDRGVMASLHRSLFRGLSACLLGGSLLMGGLTVSGCVKSTGTSPTQTELTVELIGTVKGGQGSGVVGGPVAGVSVVATANGKTIGPVTTDAAGGFTLNGLPFLAEGTQATPAGLKAATPVSVDLKFSREGFKTQVEVVTLPFPKTQDMTFYLSGE